MKKSLQKQIESLGFNVEMMDRLLALCVHHKVSSVPEALKAAGTTIEELFPDE